MAGKKANMLFLMRFFFNETDENNAYTRKQITERLVADGADDFDRRTFYADIDALQSFGFDIAEDKRGRDTYYYLRDRTFEIPELKLLVDSVQASRFMTEKKSRQLIEKLEGLAGKPQAKQLHRQVIISGRVKSMNEAIYYNIDALNDAINNDSQISFQYFNWNIDKEVEFRHNGNLYFVSPWALTLNSENYYLVAFQEEVKENGEVFKGIKHFRVDKIKNITLTGNPRIGKEYFHEDDYSNSSIFSMYGGKTVRVTFEALNSKVGIFIDRFGKDIPITRVDDDHFETATDIQISPQFYGWLFGLGRGIRITSPTFVIEGMKKFLSDFESNYQ